MKEKLIKYKELLLYLFFGGLAFLVSIGTFALFDRVLGLNELIANVLSWIITVMFAFLTNRKWVFSAEGQMAGGSFLSQMVKFYAGRLVTLLIEEAILFVFITKIGCDSLVIKVIAQVVVIVLNYVISKLWIFRNRTEK